MSSIHNSDHGRQPWDSGTPGSNGGIRPAGPNLGRSIEALKRGGRRFISALKRLSRETAELEKRLSTYTGPTPKVLANPKEELERIRKAFTDFIKAAEGQPNGLGRTDSTGGTSGKDKR